MAGPGPGDGNLTASDWWNLIFLIRPTDRARATHSMNSSISALFVVFPPPPHDPGQEVRFDTHFKVRSERGHVSVSLIPADPTDEIDQMNHQVGDP